MRKKISREKEREKRILRYLRRERKRIWDI